MADIKEYAYYVDNNCNFQSMVHVKWENEDSPCWYRQEHLEVINDDN